MFFGCWSKVIGFISRTSGRPSGNIDRVISGYLRSGVSHPWLSVCVRVSVSTCRTSVSTHRTSVSTQRTSVAVRQHTQGVRQPTQDVRVCPCVRQYTQDVCQHTQDVRQYTQDVRQHTQDVRGRPSVHISACWPFLWTVRVILAHVGCLFSTHRTSVSTRRTSVPVR